MIVLHDRWIIQNTLPAEKPVEKEILPGRWETSRCSRIDHAAVDSALALKVVV